MCRLFHFCCSCRILTHYCDNSGPLCLCDAMSMSTMKNDASKCVTVASCVVFWCNDEQLLAHLYYSFSVQSTRRKTFYYDFFQQKKRLIWIPILFTLFYVHEKKAAQLATLTHLDAMFFIVDINITSHIVCSTGTVF